MSKAFPTDKDHTIDDMDETFKLSLTEQEYDSLRRLTDHELLLVTALMHRAVRAVKDAAKGEDE